MIRKISHIGIAVENLDAARSVRPRGHAPGTPAIDDAGRADGGSSASAGLAFLRPYRNAHQELVAFIHPKSTNGVLIELIQP